jgi:hypothetical protein
MPGRIVLADEKGGFVGYAAGKPDGMWDVRFGTFSRRCRAVGGTDSNFPRLDQLREGGSAEEK